MKIIRRAAHHESTSYAHHFEFEDLRGAGYGFDCDKDGIVKNPPPAYAKCLTGEVDGRKIRDQGIKAFTRRWRSPAVGLCVECGQEVELAHFTNTCNCGADYNSAGQRLAPRSQWGEETGESVDDILSIRW